MSDCFWTDLVRVEQECDEAPADTPFIAILPAANESYTGMEFMAYGDWLCVDEDLLPGTKSGEGDGTHFSARYSITPAQFDALTCGDSPDLTGLSREVIYVTYVLADMGFNCPPHSGHGSPGILAYSWPEDSCWILEITPVDLETFDICYIAIAVR